MTRKIVTYPNPILRKKSKDVVQFDTKLHTLLDDMNDTMLEKGGVGLAAIQVGVALNILIINIPVKDETSQEQDAEVQLEENLIEAINPTIVKKDGEYVFNEGCLSVPGFNAEVTRAKEIEVKYFDRFGQEQTMHCEEFLAVAWQHEMEHLSGHVFVDNLSFLKRKKFEKEWKKELKEKAKKRKK
jgi:peptide deformylase